MSNLKNRKIYIDISSNKVVTEGGATLMSRPQFIYGSAPNIEFNLREGTTNVDVSDAEKWQLAIDNDFDLGTAPMVIVPSSDFITSGAASGIIVGKIDTLTQKFAEVVSGKQSVQAFMELRGLDADDSTIYCSQFAIDCLGAVYLPSQS